jgi:hypothetical protein
MPLRILLKGATTAGFFFLIELMAEAILLLSFFGGNSTFGGFGAAAQSNSSLWVVPAQVLAAAVTISPFAYVAHLLFRRRR